MGVSGTRMDLGKVSARYAKRRAETPKDATDASVAQVELLRIVEDSSSSIHRANNILNV